jgi:Zn-dependent protease with chaperone function
MLKQHGGSDSILHFLETNISQVVLISLVAIAVVWVMVDRGLPAAADLVAYQLSQQTLRDISEPVYEQLEAAHLPPSELPTAERERAQSLFDHIAGKYDDYDYRLRIHDMRFASLSTANAFALPDGLIVATDRMIQLLDDDEITAVFAHEIGHVEDRHGVRAVLSATATFIFVILAGGDMSGFLATGAALNALAYSRSFERGADCFAYDYLIENDLSPDLIGSALLKMERDMGSAFDEQIPAEQGKAGCGGIEGATTQDMTNQPEEDLWECEDVWTHDADQHSHRQQAGDEHEADGTTVKTVAGDVARQILIALSTHPETEDRQDLERICAAL